MPFESEAQRRFMWAKHPRIAKRWAHEYPGQHDLPKHKHKKKHEKKSSEVGHMTLVERVVDAFQANAAALGAAEKLVNEKQAADQAYENLVPKVVDICAKFGKIDDTPEEKQALAGMLATPAGALDVIAKLAAFVDEGAPSSIGGQQVDASGKLVQGGHQKRGSYNSLESPYVGRRTAEKPQSWTNFERGLGLA